jgi:septal ring-binding cell division protein DamX
MQQRPGTSNVFIILLIVLLGAALAVGYFLYFRPEPPDTAEVTVPTSSRTAKSSDVQTRIRRKVTAEKAPETPPDPAEVLAEFHTPFLPTPPHDLITPDLPDIKTAKVSQPEPAKPEPEKPETPKVEEKPVPEPAKPEPKIVAPPPKAEASPAPTLAKAPKPSKGGKWVANVLSTRDGEVARHVLDQLMNLPYRVYAYKTVVKGKEYYRIRVGFFNTSGEAEKVGMALSAQYRLPKPWVVRPGPQELKKYQD